MRDIAINRLMTTDPVTVAAGDSVLAAKQLLVSSNFHHLPVVEDGVLVGIVSSSDLLKLHLLGDDVTAISNATVRQVMEANPVVLKSGASLRDAATTLSVGSYHALPVVEGSGALIGIVTTVDLVTHLLQQVPRGDGSIQETARPESESAYHLSDSEMSTAVRQAKRSEDSDGDEDILSRAFLHLRDRNRLLENVRKAAELYLRTGNGEREHSVLVKRLAELQRQ